MTSYESIGMTVFVPFIGLTGTDIMECVVQSVWDDSMIVCQKGAEMLSDNFHEVPSQETPQAFWSLDEAKAYVKEQNLNTTARTIVDNANVKAIVIGPVKLASKKGEST